MDAIKRWFNDAMIAAANAGKTPDGMVFDAFCDGINAYISESKVPGYAAQHGISIEQARLEVYLEDGVISEYGYNAGILKIEREKELKRKQEEEEYNRNPAKPFVEARIEKDNRKATLNGIYNELNRQGYNFNSVDEYMNDNYGNFGYYDQ